MTDKYCLRGEIKKPEFKIWNLKVKGTDVVAYSQRFQELALMCDRMFPKEIDKVKKYVDGLPDTIHGSVMATKSKTMQDAIEFAIELMNKKINTWLNVRLITKENLMTPPGTTIINQTRDKTLEELMLQRMCTIKCANYKRVGHLTRDYRSPAATNNHRNPTCHECRNQGYYKSDCLELKNQDHGNQARGTGAHGMVHALEGGETNQDLNDMEDDINA
nr:hypothetical protein [Tanacetum cinerariifolium]